MALLVLLVGAVALVGFAFAGSPDVVPAGATVAGVDVSGLPVAEAAERLEGRTNALLHRPVVFVAGDARLELSASQLGVRPAWREAIGRAASEGEGFGPLRGLRRLGLRITGNEVTPRIEAYRSAVAYSIAQLAQRTDERAVPARIQELHGRFVVVPGAPGRVLDRARAAELMVSTLAALDRPTRVDLPLAVEAPPVTVAGLHGALAAARAAIAAPVRVAHGDTVTTIGPTEMRTLLRLPAGGSRQVHLAGPAAEGWFRLLSDRVSRPPADAGWEVTADGRVRVRPAVDGVVLDVARTRERLEQVAFARTRRTVRVAVRSAHPRRSTEQATSLGIRDVVASYTTTFGGTPGRLHNVQLVAQLIDGALVAPGAGFSFNEVTGERNASKGFEEATVIINGELQTGIGGGVCQVSTTVFNAAFEAGLPITARTNHALYIPHYPLGRDATVNYPDVDLRFVNDTEGWLLVRTFVGPGALTVKLLGRSPGRKVETETSPLVVVGKTPFEVVRDPDLVRGTRIVERIGTHPRQTSVRRLVYDRGGALLSDRVWYSTYLGEPTVVRVGTRAPDPVASPGSGVPAGEPADATAPVPATDETSQAAGSDADSAPAVTIPAPTPSPRP